MRKVMMTGAGGFIGRHLVSYLKNHGYWARGVDVIHEEALLELIACLSLFLVVSLLSIWLVGAKRRDSFIGPS